jgi:hypothetical protein
MGNGMIYLFMKPAIEPLAKGPTFILLHKTKPHMLEPKRRVFRHNIQKQSAAG